MTTGALLFAFNNEKTDYVKMAVWSARRIRHFLDIPVSVVTDSTSPELDKEFQHVIRETPQTGGQRYFEDYGYTVSWHNAGRTDAYDLSPYDQTLVLDSDYVVCGDQLRQVLAAPQDFLAHRDAVNVIRPKDYLLDRFGRNQYPMWWATVMMFRRSTTARYIFESMRMIKANYEHYRNLYGITEKSYRNDYALSISLGLLSGHTLKVDSIPWPLISALPDTELTVNQAGDAELWTMRYQDSMGRDRTFAIAGQDFHAMGKSHLEAAIEAS